MRAMKIAALYLASGSLASCAIKDPCAGAATRRAGYLAAIGAADAYAASGRPVPAAVTLGREAAVTALAIVDARCPRLAGEDHPLSR